MKERSGTAMKKRIPEFKNEDDERKFWATVDSTEYVAWSSAKRRKLVHLKPSLKTISLRLPVSTISRISKYWRTAPMYRTNLFSRCSWPSGWQIGRASCRERG